MVALLSEFNENPVSRLLAVADRTCGLVHTVLDNSIISVY